ncbi:CD209 antigen-like protein A [Glandiceps talaboti]
MMFHFGLKCWFLFCFCYQFIVVEIGSTQIDTTNCLPHEGSLLGCYKDSDTLGLCDASLELDPSIGGMTIDSCVKHCASMGFSFAGLYNGYQCWCSKSFDDTATKLNNGCDTPCSGNANQQCGGDDAVSVYKIELSQPPKPCPDGWKYYESKSTCYYFGLNRKSWQNARSYCQSMNGDLAKSDSSGVNVFLTTEIKNMGFPGRCSEKYIWNCNFYFSLQYRPGSGWCWADGSSADLSIFSHWRAGEPNDGNVAKSAELELRDISTSSIGWNDRSFTYHSPDAYFVCEKKAS